jgi:hypothetical protein
MRFPPVEVALGLAALVAFGFAAEGAAISRIQADGVTRYIPSHVSRLPSNTKDGTTDPITLILAGDEAISSASLKGTSGSLTLAAHGCSGPNPGLPTGTANSNSYADYFERFVVRSDTLPNGTPVTITFKLTESHAFRASVIQPFPIRIGDAAVGGNVLLLFYSDISGSRNFQGTFAGQQVDYGPVTRSTTGMFASSITPPGGEEDGPVAAGFLATLPALVGGSFTLDFRSQLSASSSAASPVISDGDAQMVLMWGADVLGGLATITTPDGSASLPPTSNATIERAVALLPPPPHTLIVPEPNLLPLLLAPVALLHRPRRQSKRDAAPLPC